MADKEYHLVVWDKANPNTYVDVEELNNDGVLHFHVFRDGQTVDEYLAEMEAGKVRESLGLPPGRTMPTQEEIDAGPVLPPPPRRRVDRLTIIKRLDVLGLLDVAEKAIAAADPLTRWRWNVATDGVYADDEDTRDFLKKIGANPDAILAP